MQLEYRGYLYLNNLLKRLIILFNSSYRLDNVTQYHIQVLIVRLKCTATTVTEAHLMAELQRRT
jgi:hypothetical protein